MVTPSGIAFWMQKLDRTFNSMSLILQIFSKPTLKPEKLALSKIMYEKFGPKGPINLIYSTRQEQYLFLVDFENLYNSLRSWG